MLITSVIATFGFAASISALAFPGNNNKPDTNTTLPLPEGKLRWHAPAEMGNITIEGTHAEVIAKISALRPIWQTNATHYKEFREKHRYNHTAETALGKRSNRYNQFCDQHQFEPGGALADYNIEMNNVEYIYRHYGAGWCEAAPHTCARFSCSYNNAIVMCNDENTPAIIPCSTLAQNAAFVAGHCRFDRISWDIQGGGTTQIDPGDASTEGQAFYHNPNYNVLVKYTDPGKHC